MFVTTRGCEKPVIAYLVFNLTSKVMKSNINCSYMAMSSLTYILDFLARFFQPVYSVLMICGGPLSKLSVTPPFAINFRCQIENQVSDLLTGSQKSYWYIAQFGIY
jgi:hypothetical protein